MIQQVFIFFFLLLLLSNRRHFPLINAFFFHHATKWGHASLFSSTALQCHLITGVISTYVLRIPVQLAKHWRLIDASVKHALRASSIIIVFVEDLASEWLVAYTN